jgi:hypothetical protein
MARQRLTASNVKKQAETAPAGALVHSWWSDTCSRKFAGTDETPDSPPMARQARHIENITCLYCRREYYRLLKKRHEKQKSENAG